MAKILGLDVGTKTVGVALSDAFGWTAQGVETIQIDEGQGKMGYDRVGELISANSVELVVLGLPKHMNNDIGERAEASMKYGAKLEEKFGVRVAYQDERMTTMQAERVLIDGNVRRENRKKVIDKLAAVLILQNYLDSH
ncbi:MAG: Holliday junction resolvase RuvX [Lactobacillales bacterium]|jgi:putative Holliday junction resolvase|nr:Holliday junction resolvase RuvX [Lactobacillales bacterium]